eukprot:TRINITY_DN4315_c0_g1_i1.p1 TRINITY_DN4315_c0_g1~~TRINITY_DN4315_c0_g1_i1.p1  ORF type:complete len:342 (+),score=59.70 TRINITY_DN4315_c0_g1_i1:43-1026(+)
MAMALRRVSCLHSRLVLRPRSHGFALRAAATQPPGPPPPPRQQSTPAQSSSSDSAEQGTGPKVYRERLLDGGEEILTEAEKQEKDAIIKDLTKRLSGPLADEHGNVPTGEDRPIAIEVDGPSHFYANSKRYTAYTKLKHRLLTRMGYKVLHVPYFEWRRLRGAKEREEYMRAKLLEEPTEWLDPEDEKYYNQGPDEDEEEFSVKPETPATPPAPPSQASAWPERASPARASEQSASSSRAPPGVPAPPPSASSPGAAPPRRGYDPPPVPPTPPPPPAQPPVLKDLDKRVERRSSPPPPRPPLPPGSQGGNDQPPVISFPPFPPPPRK